MLFARFIITELGVRLVTLLAWTGALTPSLATGP